VPRTPLLLAYLDSVTNKLSPPPVAPIAAQVHTTPVRATELAARTIGPAAALRSEHDSAQDSPTTSLPVIRDKRRASPALLRLMHRFTQLH